MATLSSILAWRIPWTEEPGGLQSTVLQRVRQDWNNLAHTDSRLDKSYLREAERTKALLVLCHFGFGVPTPVLEKEMATHSSILAWRIPWTEEPGRLQSMGSQRIRHDWGTSLHFTPVLYQWSCCPGPLLSSSLSQSALPSSKTNWSDWGPCLPISGAWQPQHPELIWLQPEHGDQVLLHLQPGQHTMPQYQLQPLCLVPGATCTSHPPWSWPLHGVRAPRRRWSHRYE